MDADVLMDSFFTDFEIDYSDFRYEKYFPWGIHAIKNVFMLRRAWECDLEHLHKVVIAKKWFDPERYSKTK
ncbi:MAG: DUF1493 family protein [Sphingobacteriales bacterium JAD_PAG50586_3]|nr:MAG: DUF1493 family protein [Sphingobacteriales bacterium JAD_PAG50586_3]